MYLREDEPLSDADHWDLYDRGPRLYVFPTNLESALASLATTLLLYEPMLSEGILTILHITKHEGIAAVDAKHLCITIFLSLL